MVVFKFSTCIKKGKQIKSVSPDLFGGGAGT